MEEDCVFCRIIEGEIPSHKLYEDDKVLAFLDTNPVSKGHALVVPKEHVETIFEADGMDYMWDAIVKVARALKGAFSVEGMNIDQNNGPKAGQEIFHMHFHLTPRYTGDEIDLEYDRGELEDGGEIAEKIKSNIN